ncbi:MAG: hypothetical protein K0R67_2234 [Paenibacillus sp.]|jgi:hypothetical protein|nr:hypothetical protein [Paenibacillus sp.]
MDIKSVRSYNPYLYIWGAQWIVGALLVYFLNLETDDPKVTTTTWAAVLLTLISFGVRFWKRKNTEGHDVLTQSRQQAQLRFGNRSRLILLCGYLILCAALLIHAGQQSYYLFDVSRALVLGIIYMILGIMLGSAFLLLAMWLLTLTAILTIWYLGFAPLVLMFFGGWSLIACALILHIRSKSASR